MTLVSKKGASPHKYVPMEKRKNRLRGSHPKEILVAIYEKGASFICPVTGEDPGKYFKQYKRMWMPQRIHYPISYAELRQMGVKDLNAIQYVMFASPNGHNMLDNHRKGIVSMEPHESQTCYMCNKTSWEMFQTHKKVLKMENHHVTKFGTFPLCPTCHASTEDHSVNDDKVPFPVQKFAELLELNILNIDTLHVQLKKYSPKITKDAIKQKFYGMGLHRFYDNELIPVPNYLRKFFPNKNSRSFFRV